LALLKEQKMVVALFRFGLIAPLLNNQVDDRKADYRLTSFICCSRVYLPLLE
jgi:hypothetical protein